MRIALLSLFAAVALVARLNAGILDIVHNFGTPIGNTGVSPSGAVTFGPDGTLYGVDSGGGLDTYGTVYNVLTNGFTFALWNFTGGSDGSVPVGGLVLSGNTLYGVTAGFGYGNRSGTVYKINTDGSGFAVLFTFTNGPTGGAPEAGLTLSGNTLYGTTNSSMALKSPRFQMRS